MCMCIQTVTHRKKYEVKMLCIYFANKLEMKTCYKKLYNIYLKLFARFYVDSRAYSNRNEQLRVK